MLRLDKVIKPWKESAALNDHINLYGFWNETAFLTKSGDIGMILSVPGVDYESLDRSQQEYAVKRLEAALKAFGPGFHVYQYLFKSNRPDIPFATYDDPIVETAIDQRRKFFALPSRNCGSIPVPEAGPMCDKARFPWHRRCEIRRNVWLPHEVCC
jgi:type IV secretion system protein VirB4